jgi:hypothetical protein
MNLRQSPMWPATAVLACAALALGAGIGYAVGARNRPAPHAAREPAPTAATTARAARPHVPAPAAPFARHVVIISIDGLRPDLLALVPTPNLRALIQSGSYTLWAQTVDHPYVYTLPSHVSMLTGVNPDRHGVTWNEYIEQSYPNVPTLFDLARKRGLTTAIASGKMKFIAFTRPDALDWSYLPPSEPVEDGLVAGRASEMLRRHRPNVMLVHLPGVDTWGHERGWGSPEQLAALARADAAAGTVLAALRDSGMEPTTLLIATADHGGAGLTHWGEDPRSRTIPWVARGPGIRRGQDLTRYVGLTVRTEDTFATACAALGIPIPADSEGRFVEAILEGRELLRGTDDAPAPGAAR